MQFDFDTVIDRRGTHCEKWDEMESHFGVSATDGIPLWVADMEFSPPPAVQYAFQRMVDHNVYGYTGDYTDYHNAITNWMATRHKWEIEPSWISATHGIVVGINIIIQAFCTPGDEVILQTPVYYPFFSSIRNNGCHVITNKLKKSGNTYQMDLEDLKAQITPRTRMIILCSPHNPGGRVWKREELEALAEICLENDILIVSDEIHHDLVYEGNSHTVMATLSPEIAARTITCTSATKTFNLAGTLTGNVIISNPSLRRRFTHQLHSCGMYLPNAFGMIAATAAYSHGAEWLDQLLVYLQQNRDLTHSFITEKTPGMHSMPLQGTYLAWLDCSGTSLPMQEVVSRIQDGAKLALSHGHTFGPGGEQFMRLNFACARSQLTEALNRLEKSFCSCAV